MLRKSITYTTEDFLSLIRRTFDDYYKEDYNRGRVEIGEYNDLFHEMVEMEYIGSYLVDSPSNILNNRSVPWLDIGDLPATYVFARTEPYQSFAIPQSNPPNHYYLVYSEWLDGYVTNFDKLIEGLADTNRRITK